MKTKRLVFALIWIGTAFTQLPLSAAVRLPHIFSDNLVLQRDKPVPVWGWANQGETVKVKYGQQEKSATADDNGRWMVRLDPMPANKTGGELTVTGENTIAFKNVLVGDVWVCSGQSNMEMAVGGVLNAAAEIAASAEVPMIRLIKVPHVHCPFPQNDMNGSWQVAGPGMIGGYTAVGYFFARELVKNLDVPVGLIDSNWGGTRIETWISREGFAAIPELKDLSRAVEDAYPDSETGRKRYQEFLEKMKEWLAQAEKGGVSKDNPVPFPVEPWLVGDCQQLTHLFNAKISPLVPYAIHGAIWYQGCSNGGEGETYFHKMRALIGGWRQAWKPGDPATSSGQAFPFYFVQLANFQKSDPNNPAGGDGWARLREAQLKALTIPNTGMAVIIDIGDANDIHPKNKQDVGKRLAAWALAKDYQKAIPYSGPLYKSCQVEGDKIRVTFDCAASGLMVGEKSGLDPVKEVAGGKLKWISIAGEDKKFFWADAAIDGQTLVVSCKDVPKPVAVRYAFTMNPEGTGLYNKDGLPASPFRTDAW